MKNPCEKHRTVKAELCPVCMHEELERLRVAASALRPLGREDIQKGHPPMVLVYKADLEELMEAAR